MQETMVTLQGYLGTDVTLRQAGDSAVATFRIGCTPRRYSRRTGSWDDAATQWFTVNAWRGLGENAFASLKRSDPVVVHGRLNASTWINKESVEVTRLEVDATFIGPDLTRGTTTFQKTVRTGDVAPSAEVSAPPDLAATDEEMAA